jgi:hypothetical protein
MTKMLELTPEQQKAYNRYITARNKVRRLKCRPSTISHCIDVAGLNHPVYVVNEDYVEYELAFKAWLKVEPLFRQVQRMSAIRGDYGTSDNWDEKPSRIKEL